MARHLTSLNTANSDFCLIASDGQLYGMAFNSQQID